MSGAEARREELHAWLCDFLWEFYDSGMSNSEAAERILATLETWLPIEQKTPTGQLKAPVEIFRVWKNRWGQS